ncbi:MAG: DNA repair protein RadC [Oscillospiraceae bacterium]
MKKRFAEHGLDNFDDVNVIELLLFYAHARCDTNAIAHALLDRFGTLDGVFEASVVDLEKIDGIGESTAVFLKLVPQVSRRYMLSKTRHERILSSSEKAGRYSVPLFMYEKDEVVYMICLDSKCRVICSRELSRGVVNATEVSVRRIVEQALSYNAASVIIAHNHVAGIALPSREDELTTRHIATALHAVGILLADHIIVAGNDYISLMDSGLMRHI